MAILEGAGTIISVLKIIGAILIVVILGGLCTWGAIVLAKKAKSTKIVEVDMNTRRIRTYLGKDKKTAKGTRQFWAQKIRKFLPDFQAKDKYLKGKQDLVFLLKDNNGLFHTMRIPTYKQIKKWYQVMYNVDISELDDKDTMKLRNIYMLPNPHEDLDWLANVLVESKKEFSIDVWYKSPTVLYIAMGFICMIMFFGTIILARKL